MIIGLQILLKYFSQDRNRDKSLVLQG